MFQALLNCHFTTYREVLLILKWTLVQCKYRRKVSFRVEQTNLVAKKEAFASPKLGVERVALTLDMCEGSA